MLIDGEYDKVNLVLAVTAATHAFHRRWRGVLGLSYGQLPASARS